jgi:hypothetical protein
MWGYTRRSSLTSMASSCWHLDNGCSRAMMPLTFASQQRCACVAIQTVVRQYQSTLRARHPAASQSCFELGSISTPQVAFSRNGDVFIADGYCNSRVMQFAADGTFVQQYTHPEVQW